ncbi:hypothetical protein PSA7680_03186 [Pseudoruegeria aquimaris]|uniref:Acid-resistance membrane protein n=1 Tax=Pseudoruegeria aquimaris TaxID=393663 RepID=A0A1Y5TFA5_9RHOB|nr:hypothetical protein [Pseudoruegeria aquimaris]SLN60577.1 hypothetical protein PSA7680_03186 [Pseudoruegeria aquimaris]
MTDPQATTARADSLRASLARNARFYMLQAGVMLLAGLFAVIYPYTTGPVDTEVIAWLLFLYAATLLVGLLLGKRMRGIVMQLLAMLTAAMAGFVILIQLTEAAGFAIILIGLFLLLEGLARLRQGLGLRPRTPWVALTIGGIVPLAASGFLLIFQDGVSGPQLAFAVGASLIASGVGLGTAAARARKEAAGSAA